MAIATAVTGWIVVLLPALLGLRTITPRSLNYRRISQLRQLEEAIAQIDLDPLRFAAERARQAALRRAVMRLAVIEGKFGHPPTKRTVAVALVSGAVYGSYALSITLVVNTWAKPWTGLISATLIVFAFLYGFLWLFHPLHATSVARWLGEVANEEYPGQDALRVSTYFALFWRVETIRTGIWSSGDPVAVTGTGWVRRLAVVRRRR